MDRRPTVAPGVEGEDVKLLSFNSDTTIGILFQGLDILQPEIASGKKKKRTEKASSNVMELLLQKAERKSWPIIFHERMAERSDVLETSRIAYYKEMFKWYYEFHDMSNRKHKHKQLIQEFYDFVDTHKHDPDNALIGLSLSKLALGKAVFSETAEPVADGMSPRGRGPKDSFTREALVAKIMGWSQLKPEVIASEVFRFASKLKASDGFQRGDLVAVKMIQRGKEGIIFARVVKQVDEKSVVIRVTPEEVGAKSVPLENVHDVTLLQPWFGNVSTMQVLVDDPIKNYATSMETEIRQRCKTFLEVNGIDIELLERLKNHAVKLEHFDSLQTMSTTVAELVNDKDQKLTKFLAETKAFIHERVAIFANDLDQSILFKPSNDSQMKKLSAIPHMAEKILRNLVDTCQQTVKKLRTSMDELMKGTTKTQLTGWWLNLIESQVESFLLKKNFKFSAIPEKYLDEPSNDVEGLLSSKVLLETILKPSKDCLQLIANLKKAIYPRIDTFCQNTMVMVARHVGLDPTADSDTLHSALEEKKDTLEEATRSWVENALKDADYLLEMKSMEEQLDHQDTEQKKVEMTNVVPVSGLVMGKFMIYSNMIHTCLDVYRKFNGPIPSHPDTPSPREKPEPEKVESPQPSKRENDDTIVAKDEEDPQPSPATPARPPERKKSLKDLSLKVDGLEDKKKKDKPEASSPKRQVATDTKKLQMELAMKAWSEVEEREPNRRRSKHKKKSKHSEEKRGKRRQRRVKRVKDLLQQQPNEAVLQLMIKQQALEKLLANFQQFCKKCEQDESLSFCVEAESFKESVMSNSQSLRNKFWHSPSFHNVVPKTLREQVDGEVETCPSIFSFRRVEEKLLEDLSSLLPEFYASESFQPGTEVLDVLDSMLKVKKAV